MARGASSARRAAAATPARTTRIADDRFGKVNMVIRRKSGAARAWRQEPLPEMPAELKALLEERK